MKQEWGCDPFKWIIEKSCILGDWLLWPPGANDDPYRFPTFHQVIEALK